MTDQYGNPVAGVSVGFAVASGGGSATGTSATTDASGVAAVGSWTLGAAAGSNSLTATSSGLTGSPVTFHATGTADAASAMVANGGDGQSATVGTDVSTAPSVAVTDQYGNPVSGVAVTFAVATGGGSVTGANATTDASGVAGVGSWTLGTTAGSNTVTASASGLTSVTFHATGLAGAPGSMTIDAGESQTATVNTNVPTAPAVLVTDDNGNPVAGVSVTFAVASGGGSVTGGSATTGADGVATVGSWKLGTGAGANTLSVTSTGLPSITFHATATADAASVITVSTGDNQTATVDTNVSSAPQVLVTDQYGNPVSAVSVTFAVASGGGSITGAVQATDSNGLASVGSWKLGTAAGSNTLTATSTGLTGSPITFHATGVAGSAGSMAANAGDGQTATVNTAVATDPSVLVTDALGNPVSGVSVTFAVASGGGSVTGAHATTGADGIATVGSWTVGTAAGTNTLTADATGLPTVTFTADGVAGAAANLDANAGDSQSATVNTNVTAPSVIATDAYGNPVSGVTVTFAVASGGGSATGTTRVTGSNGIATVGSWKLGTAAGANSLTADATGLSTVTFNATGTPDSASSLDVSAGDNQTATVGTAVATAPAAIVTDQYGNPISGVAVSFAVSSGGGSATGTSATTNGSGIAAVGSWTLGTAAGSNGLTAASAGLADLTFHATGAADAAATIAASAGESQSATVGTNLPTDPAVVVEDQYGNPVAGVSVTFAVASGGGSATGLSATTGANGVATVGSWKLGTAAGSNTLTADSGTLGGSPVTFHALGVADAAGSLTVSAGEGQSATVGTAVATAPAVLVTDEYGNPVQGVNVTFSVASGGGSATGTSATTDVNGIATLGSWTLGTAAGSNTLTASATGLTTVTFHATGTADAAASMTLNGGDNQTATVDTDVSSAPSVLVEDQYGNPVAGVSVTFAVTSGGGSATGTNATTDASGVATVGSWKLGTVAGSNGLKASATGLSDVTFHATAVAGSAGTMAIDGGESQSATVNTAVATDPSVLVTDALGNPVQGVAVTFAVASGGGSVTGATTTTDASGVATVGSWKLGTTAGSNTLSVTSTGLPSVTFHATGTADAAHSIAVSAGDNQSATVNTDVATAPGVEVDDQYGNPVAGVAVTFAVASGGGSATGLSATTGVNGIAAVGSWTLGTGAGSNTLTATSAGLAGSPVTFHATGTPDSLDHLAVSPTSPTVTAGVGQSFAAEAEDAYGNDLGDVTSSTTFTLAGGSCVAALCSTTVAGDHVLGASMTGATGSVTMHVQPDAPSSIVANGGDNQTATAGTAVATAPSVLVTDQYGNPIAGLAVTFSVASGGGSVTGANATTAADGTASVGSWTLGTAAGQNTLTATASGAGSVTFHATSAADAAATLALNGGDAQSATVATDVSTAPSAIVTDQYGNPVAGVSVTFSVASGGGSVTGANATTGADGVATVGSWTLGATAGSNALEAASAGLAGSPVTFHATGVPENAGSLSVVTGDGQSATVGTSVSTAPAAKATDSHGNPVPGVVVTFAVSAGGGSVTGATATTGSNGIATLGSWTLGTTAGTNTVTASAASFVSAPFNATGTADAATSMAVSAGNNQTATVNTNVATAPAVVVEDQYGNPVQGVSVTFAVASGGGSATGTSTSTAANGVASAGSWKLGTAAGANSLTASAAGLPSVTFDATGTADMPAALSAAAGDGQSATVGTAVATAPAVEVDDQFGNPVAGVAVTFGVASGGGSATGTSATTNATGIATVGSWTLGTTAGANALTADAASLTTVTFGATGTAGAPASLAISAGDGQSATVHTAVSTPPAALVADQYGNPVQGVAVTFAVASGGGSATGTSATTNASGVATVGSWTLGDLVGSNSLSASSTGLTDVTYHATGTVGTIDHLVLTPATATITADDTETYSVEGRDAYDNTLGDVTGATTLSVDGLPCVGAVCNDPSVGSHTVTGSMLGAVGTATLNVTSGAATKLGFVSPSTANLSLGANRGYTVAVEDAEGNVVTSDNSTSISFSQTAGAGSLSGLGSATAASGEASGTVTASGAGTVTLTATASGLSSDSVTFTVDPAPVATIDSQPSDPSTSASATFDYSADDPAATFECSLDGAAYATCPGTGSGSVSYSALADTSHTFDVRAVSSTATGPSAHDAWVVDTSSPVVSLTAPADS
ncbi:MAG TPA: Ig-like domain-containing protein, partial [Gaiellaceae bacterium]|nr:Ig-like domain-containing protein [Gaiellaceae bacterium]